MLHEALKHDMLRTGHSALLSQQLILYVALAYNRAEVDSLRIESETTMNQQIMERDNLSVWGH